MKQLWQRVPRWRKRAFIRVFSLTAIVGAVALFTRLGQPLDNLAFDLLTVIRAPRPSTNVVVVGIDDASLRELKAAESAILPRRHHAELVNRLTADHATGVVFDIFFEQDGPSPEDDTRFAQAIRDNGACVLAAYEAAGPARGTAPRSTMAPIEIFREASQGWGLSNLDPSPVVRRIWQQPAGTNSLAEAALIAFDSAAANRRQLPAGDGWLRYLGAPGEGGIRVYRYADVTNLPAGTFSGKVVFVGRMASVVQVTSQAPPDTFLTPYWLTGRGRQAGVTLHALTYANLRDGLWLRRMPLGIEALLILVLAASFAGCATLISFRRGMSAVLVLGALVVAGAASSALSLRLWSGFLVPVAVQAPFALAAGWLLRTRRVAIEAGEYDAFISYRREDGAALARLLRSELARRGYRAFLDVEDMGAVMFDERILHTIATVPAVIVVLSPKCLDRCLDPTDWVRREIQHAFQHSRFIVPVMAPEFRFPEEKELPEELRRLPTLNSVPYSHQQFAATIDQLVAALGRGSNVLQDR